MTRVSSTKSKKLMKNKRPRIYTIDFDLGKQIKRCPYAPLGWIRWRVSSSGLGFHFTWICAKARCKHCSAIEKQYDDAKRYAHDTLRPRAHRRILWDSKGGAKAGPWHKFTRTR